MANPLASIPSSIRLKTATVPTTGTVDIMEYDSAGNETGYVKTSALRVSQLSDYPLTSSTKGACTVVSGQPLIVPPLGTDMSDVTPGSTTSGTGFASATTVVKTSPGSLNALSRYGSGTSLVCLPPNADDTGIAVGAIASGTHVAAGAKVTATAAQPGLSLLIDTNSVTNPTTVTLTSGSTSVLGPGMLVQAAGIPAGTAIVSIPNDTTFVISSPATATASAVAASILGVAPVLSTTITTTSGSATATVPSTTAMFVGMFVVASTVPSGTYIQAINSATGITLSVGSGVTPGTNTAAVFVGQNALALKSEISVVDISSGSDTVKLASTGSLVLGQRIGSVRFPSGTFIKEIVSDTTIKVTNNATAYSSGTETATFGAVVALSKNLTANSTATSVSFSPVVEMAANATASTTSGSYAFTRVGRTMADMRDGDYCIVAVRMVSVSGYETYLMGYGYLRKASRGLKQFYLWDKETGGGPVTGLEVPEGTFTPFFSVSDGPHVVAIFQRPRIRFASSKSTGICGGLLTPPVFKQSTPGLQFAGGSLNGRLVSSPMFGGVENRWHLRFLPQKAAGRLSAAPDIRSIERSITFSPRRIAGRLLSLPVFNGGSLPAQAILHARLYNEAITILSSPESVYFRTLSSLTARVVARLSGNHEFRRDPHLIRAFTRGVAEFIIIGRGLSVRDVAGDCLGVWNMRLPARGGTIADDVRERIISDLNAAMQGIYSRARRLDYFNRATLTLQVNPGQRSVALPNTVQTVLGTVRVKAGEESLDSVPLFSLGSLAEAMQFGSLYGGAGATPAAYYIDRRTQPEANVVKSALMLAPPPANTVYVDMEVANEAPRYTWRDVELATPLQLPSTYAESLLLPIVRQRATTFRLFTNETLRPTIEAHYKKSMLALGLVDAAPNQAAGLQTADVGGRE